MNAKSSATLLLIVLANFAGLASASTLQIPLVTVGDPGNLADPLTGYGAVPYVYQIGEYDVTVGQYCQFLNAVATAGDPYGLYSAGMATDMPTVGITQTGNGGYAVEGNASMPMFDVNWGDAARFVNWLQNGQRTGTEGPRTTETGTYPLNGATSNAALMAVSRSTTSTWVLPTVNEWYKAAYYSGGGTNSAYWTYATQSNTTPSNLLSATGTNNANFLIADNQPPNYGFTDYTNLLTPVGAFAASPSAYGTFDQSGDVWQWNETPYGGLARGSFGGSFGGSFVGLTSSDGGSNYPANEDLDGGFRVAYVPEPGSISLLLAAAMVLSAIRLFLSVMERSLWRWVIMSFAMKAAWARRSFRKAARAPRYARKDWFARQKWYARQRWHPKRQRHAKRWRPRFESLSVECLEPRRLLTPVYWDGSTAGQWDAPLAQSHWLTAIVGGNTVAWKDGDDAVISGPPGQNVSISIPAGSQVNPSSVTFNPGASYDVSGGTIGLLANTNTVIYVEQNVTAEIDSTVSGSGSTLNKQGAGTLELTNSGNSFQSTVIQLGTLEAETTASLPNYDSNGAVLVDQNATLAVAVGGAGEWTATQIENIFGSVVFESQSNLGIDTSGGNFSYQYVIPDTGGNPMGLVKLGDNTLTLSGANTFSAGVQIDAGTLNVNSNAALGGPDGAVTFNGDATLQFAAGFTLASASGLARNISVAYNAIATFDTQTYSVTIPGVISGGGGIEKIGAGSLELDGINTYSADVENLSVHPPVFYAGTDIEAGTVVCGSYLALGGGGTKSVNGFPPFIGDSDVPLYIAGGATLDLNGQDTSVAYYGTIGDGGITRTGVQVGDIYGSGTIKDNSRRGGGCLDVDLYDYGNSNGTSAGYNGTFSGTFVRGLNGQLPSLSVDVGGAVGGATGTGTGSIPFAPDSLTLNGPMLDFAVFDEKDNSCYGAITVETPDPASSSPQMYAHELDIEHYPSSGDGFIWDSSESCTVSAALLAGESAPPATVNSGAFVYGDVEWASGELDVVGAPLTVAAGGSLQQDPGSVMTQSGSGVTIDGSYTLYDGASLAVSNSSLTVGGGGDLATLAGYDSTGADPSVVNVTNSAVNVDRDGELSLDDSQFTVTDGSAVNFGTTGNDWSGPTTVRLGGNDGLPADLGIGGSGSIYLGYCQLVLEGGGSLDTARSVVETGTDPNFGGEIQFDGGTLEATGDNSDWLYAATVPAALTVDAYGGGTIDTQGHHVTISASLTDAIGGTASLTKLGSGTLDLTGASTFSGGFEIAAGTLAINSDAALGSPGGAVSFVGDGTLQWDGSFDLASNRSIDINSGVTGTIDTQSYSAGIPGEISGTGTLAKLLVKAGAGDLNLSNQSDSVAETTINTGTLEVDGKLTGSVTVDAGATLCGDGTFSGGTVTVLSSGTLALGYSVATGTDFFGPVTFHSLLLDDGCTISDSTSSKSSIMAQILNSLALPTANSPVINVNLVNNNGNAYNASYQVLFDYYGFGYGTLGGNVASLNQPSGGELVNNTPTSSIDVATNLATGTPLYWAPGGTLGGNGVTATWDGSSTNWLPSPTGGTLTSWTNNGKYVAVFEFDDTVTGNTDTVTLADGFAAEPAAMLFLGPYDVFTIAPTTSTTNLGSLSLAAVEPIDVAATSTATIEVTINNTLPGADELLANGGGTLVLTASNNYSGGTAVLGGTLQVSSSSALGSSSATITLNGGTLQATGPLGLSAPIVLGQGGGTIDSNGNAVTIGGGGISGAGGLTALDTAPGNAAGTLTLSSANPQFSGVTIIGSSPETLILDNPDALVDSTFDTSGSGTLSFGTLTSATFGGLQGDGTLTLPVPLTVGWNNADTAFDGSLSGSEPVTKIGTGTLDLSSAYLYYLTGDLIIDGGFVAADQNVISSLSSALVFDGGGLRATTSFLTIPSGQQIDVQSGGATFDSNGFQVVISATVGNATGGGAAGGVTIMGTSATTSVVEFAASNLYQGGTTIVSGTLQIDSEAALGVAPASPATNVTFAGSGTLQWGGSFNLNQNRSIEIGPGDTATIDTQSGSGSFSAGIPGVIGGGGGLIKAGSGSLTLDPAAPGGNTFSGGIVIRAGTLNITSDEALGATTAGVTFQGNGVLLFGGDFDLSQYRPIQIDAGYTATFDTTWQDTGILGVISGGGSLSKTGLGTLALTATNAYTGSTYVDAGILNIRNGSALGSMAGVVDVSDGATLQLQGGIAVAASGTLILAGIGYDGAGALENLQDDNFWSGPIELDTSGSSSALVDSNAGNLDLTGGIDAETASYPLTFGGSGNVIVSSVGIGPNAGDVTKDGSGSLTLSTPDSYTGSTTVTGGWLVSACSGAIPDGSALSVEAGGNFSFDPAAGQQRLVLSSIYVGNGATLGLGGNDVTVRGSLTLDNGSIVNGTITAAAYLVQDGTISANLGGSAGLTMRGDGTVVLTGTNSYTAGTTIDAGATLQLGDGTVNGTIVGNVLDTGTLAFDIAQTYIFAYDIYGSGSVLIDGSGTVVLDKSGTTNNYSGTTRINAGTLELGIATALSAQSDVIIDGGTLDLAGSTLAVAHSLTVGAAGGELTRGTLTINHNTAAGAYDFWFNNTSLFTLNASLAGSGSMGMVGTGSTEMLQANTFTGGLTIQHGTLYAEVLGSVPYGPVSVLSGALIWGWDLPTAAAFDAVTGAYTTGTVIVIAVPMDEPVVVTGAPLLDLTVGSTTEQAVYVGMSGGQTLVFQYTVQPGDYAATLDYACTDAVELPNGATICDLSGNEVCPNLAVPGSAASLAAALLTIETAPPVVSSIDCVGAAIDPGASSLQFAVNFSQSVTGVDAGDFALTGGDSTGTISSVSGSGANYTVTVTGVSGEGVLGLALVYDDSSAIADQAGYTLAGSGSFTGQDYALSTSFYWDAGGGAGVGGTGQWSSGACWRVGSATGPLTDWIDGADAIFLAGTGTVTISAQITANSLDFEGDGAIVQSGSSTGLLSLVPNAASSVDCGISVSSGAATVDSNLNAGSGLVLCGGGTLTLGGTDTLSGSVIVSSGSTLSIGNSATVNIDGTFTVYATLEISGSLSVNGAGTLTVAGSGTLTNSGTLTVNGSAALTNNGTLTDSGALTINDNGTLTNNGTLYVSGGVLDNDGTLNPGDTCLLTNNGAIYLSNGGTLQNDGTVQSNGTITVDASSWVWNDTAMTIDHGGTLEIDGYLYNYGTVTVQNSSTLYSNWGYISSAGTIYVSSGSTLNSVGELWQYNSTINVLCIDDATLDNSDILVVGTLDVVNGGAVYNYVMLMDAGAINIDSTSTLDNTSTGGLDIYNHGTLANLGTFINDGGVGVTNYGTLTGSIVNNGGLGFSLYQNATCTADISGSGEIVNNSTKSVTLTGNLDNFFGQLAENPGLIIIPS